MPRKPLINFNFRTEWFLALRAITRKPLQYFLDRAQDFAEHQPNYGSDENTKDDFVYDSADYKSIFNLVRKTSPVVV